ncbi:NACHT domain-containing protein [Streptomyces sp. NPDC046909]|uniref:NACHT domain-containing protein n=1 Tax=Streptomyces sp. NPDC046909 TaxID=3155617 RepID=UPI0034102B44
MLRPERRTSNRLIRGTVLAAVAAMSLGLAVWIWLDPDVTADVATIAGLFVGLASLLLALADFFRPDPAPPDPAALADDLALRLCEQWLEEAEARQLRDPRVLPLTWTTTGRDVADVPRNVVRMRLDGRLDGRFDEVTARLAEGWSQVPNHRLVAIGEPGSGKTVLAMLLTLGLLRARAQGDPLPVLLPVSSWDPVRERLDDWIVRTLAQPYYNGRADIPRTLLTHGLLLPVLDGLDEIPESARRSAIKGINHAIGGERPVVVTCRAAEYEELIRGGAPTLRRAAVVEISPVPAGDVIGYLDAVDWPRPTSWRPLFTHLRTDPCGPLAQALSTPLMVTSARLVYERGGGDPGELLDTERFDSAYAVEDHLINGLVDAAYARDPRLPEGAVGEGRERWSAGEARRWLTFLACYLHDRRERDLAWWLLSGRLLSRWAGPVMGLALAVVLIAVAAGWMTATGSIGPDSRSPALIIAIGIGGIFALLNSLVWYASEARPPGRLAWSVRGSADRLLRGFRSGAAVALLTAGPVVLGVTAVRVVADPGGRGTPRAVELYVEDVTVSAALAVVAGLALAAHNWLDAPPSRATQVGPRKSLVQDRRSALASAGLAGAVVALTGLLGWYVGVVAGDFLLRLLTRWTGWPGRPDVSVLAGDRWRTVTGVFSDWQTAVGIAVLLPGTFFALLVLTGRAWPRFVVARVYLAARGQLPWRLMAFLADARRRELLRQAGGVYQFRHIRLQETLAGEATYLEERGREAARRAEVRRRAVLAAGAGVVVAGAAWGLSRRRDRSVATLAVPGKRPVVAVAMRPRQGWQVAYELEPGGVWLADGADQHSAPVLLRAEGDYYPAPSLAFSSTGRFLAMNDLSGRGVGLWDLHPPLSLARLNVLRKDQGEYADALVAFHGDLLAGALGSTVALWKVSGSGAVTRLPEPVPDGDGTQDDIVDMAFLRDGSLATLDASAVLRRCPPPRFSTVKEDLPRPTLWEKDEDLSDASLCAASHDDAFALFGFERAELWRRQGTGWGRPVSLGALGTTGAFHPTEPLLAVGDLYGGDIQLWHTDAIPEARKGRKLTGHNAPVLALDFSLDGNWLASGSDDGTVRIWDAGDLL